jgi:hypothetical protein
MDGFVIYFVYDRYHSTAGTAINEGANSVLMDIYRAHHMAWSVARPSG